MPEKRSLSVADFWALRTVSNPRLSPDGQTVAFVVGSYDEAHNQARSAIWLAAIAGGYARQVTSGEAQDTQPRWSPDGTRLTFVSTRHEGKPQIFITDLAGGEPRRLTSHPSGAYSRSGRPTAP